ncbi:MAG: patatin-like phospholipase family protein [Paracoccaceae bacterium]|jgi:NTE family protein|nr:patatin-like phospholipase family protein [Paracoccaceae bacterium]
MMDRWHEGFGVALGGGGARGWCHVGVLRALEDKGLSPGGAAGCSMGALVGAAWAAGKLAELEEWAHGLTRAQVLSYVDLGLGKGGLVAGRAVWRILDDLDVPERIEELDRPLILLATDMETGREIWISDGDLRAAVRASISIPGVFRPHRIDGRWLLDGGLVNPVPISAVRALGFRRILGVNPNARGAQPCWTRPKGGGLWPDLAAPSLVSHLPEALQGIFRPVKDDEREEDVAPDYLQVVSVAIDILTGYLCDTRLAADPPDALLEAVLGHIGVLELDRAAEAIDAGRTLVEADGDMLARLTA